MAFASWRLCPWDDPLKAQMLPKETLFWLKPDSGSLVSFSHNGYFTKFKAEAFLCVLGKASLPLKQQQL